VQHFGDKLNKQTVVHVWKAKETMQGVVQAGYRALLSDADLWYLDHLDITWQQVCQPPAVRLGAADVALRGDDWQVYNNEPLEGIDDPDQQKLVLGGQAQMWGETVDPSDLMNTSEWPYPGCVVSSDLCVTL
jgi:hexosaminidase